MPASFMFRSLAQNINYKIEGVESKNDQVTNKYFNDNATDVKRR